MSRMATFLTRRRGGEGWHWTDIVTWVWLIGGLVVMFGPAVWLVALVVQDPGGSWPNSRRRSCRMSIEQVQVEGYDKPLTSTPSRCPTARTRQMAEVRRIGIVAQMVDPKNPGDIVKVNIADRTPVRAVSALPTRTTPSRSSSNDFLLYLRNSVFVTAMATLITLLTNSMAAFALSKYQFRGPGRGDAAHRRHADGAALGDPGAALFGGQRGRAVSIRSGG